MTQLANFVFFFVEYLAEDDRKRPKHVEILLHNLTFVLIGCAVTGTF
jgi:hypothetical protein